MLNLNTPNKQWNMYLNTLSSISGDNLTIKPYNGQNLLLEVSANNNIFIKKGDVSYNLSNLVTGTITSIISGTDASFSNIDVSRNVNPLNDNGGSLGSSIKRWGNAYIRDISATNISISGTLSVSGTISNVIRIIPQLTNDISTSLGTSSNIWQKAFICDLSAITTINGLTWPLTIAAGPIGPTGPTGPTGFDGSTGLSGPTGPIGTLNTTQRIYQNICGAITWTSVNGDYGLAKDAYTALNPLSSGVKAVQTWTVRTTGVEPTQWRYICWSARRRLFVAVASSGGNKVMISSNGINWSPISVTAADGATASDWRSVCWSQQLSLFVAVAKLGTNRVMTSEDGITWTPRTSGVEVSGWHDICWSAELGIFVAVANIGTYKVMTSSDGKTWTRETTENTELYGVCWSAELGLFVAVGDNVANRVMISSNGKTWRPITITQGLQTFGWLKVCWSPQLGLFAAVAWNASNTVMISNDGINWTPKTVETVTGSTDSIWINICWSAELSLFIAVAEHGTYRLMTSNNGLIWTKRTTHVVNNGEWNGICWSPELGIAVAVAKVDNAGLYRVMTSSLKGCPPTSYNVFDSCFNKIVPGRTLLSSGGEIRYQGYYPDYINTRHIYRDIGSYTFTPQFNGTVEVLIIGGGGGGGPSGGGGGGGGGAGAVIYIPSITISAGFIYPIVVGDGGPSGTNGQNSSAFTAIAAGGGAGGSYPSGFGISGGSGGGAGANVSILNQGGGSLYSSSSLGTNSGTIYGNRGGNMTTTSGASTRAAGGGGAGSQGVDTNPNATGDTYVYGGAGGGGAGVLIIIEDPDTRYYGYYGAGGGGGGCWGGRGGMGGGGGGAGVNGGAEPGYMYDSHSRGDPTNGGTANGGNGANTTGSGGGGGAGASGLGGRGGTGFVVIRYNQGTTTILNQTTGVDETGKWAFDNVFIRQPLMVNSTSYISDDRVKHNEVVIANGLDIIDKLTPKFYQKTLTMLDASYNGDLSGHAWTHEAGLIAQELLQISDISYVVSGGDYYEQTYNLIIQTNTLSNSTYEVSNAIYEVSNSTYEVSNNLITRPYNVNYNSIFVYGLAAIKELHTKVKAQDTSVLDEEINRLVTRVEALE